MVVVVLVGEDRRRGVFIHLAEHILIFRPHPPACNVIEELRRDGLLYDGGGRSHRPVHAPVSQAGTMTIIRAPPPPPPLPLVSRSRDGIKPQRRGED